MNSQKKISQILQSSDEDQKNTHNKDMTQNAIIEERTKKVLFKQSEIQNKQTLPIDQQTDLLSQQIKIQRIPQSSNSLVKQTHQQHSYRPDIDGLRAIAVTIVIIYHAYPEFIPGGFIGVDIFFVISGYLISCIIIKSTRKKSFSYMDFYRRRIRRIYPALIVVLLAVLIAGYFRIMSFETKIVMKTMATSTVFGTNIQMIMYERDYFDPDQKTNPLLHLWSLGVEEQFYIFWPLILSFILKLTRKGSIYFLVVFTSLSFISSIFIGYVNTQFAFYFPFTRFWEMSLGGLLALNITKEKLNPINQIISTLGLTFIFIIIWILDQNSLYPGWWAIIPTLGGSFLIWGGKDTWVNKQILSNKILIFIGKISYPMYLWHWPLFVYSRQLQQEDSQSIISYPLTMIILTFLLSCLTYFIIQQQIRYLKQSKVVISLVVIMLVIGLTAYGLSQKETYQTPTQFQAFDDKQNHLFIIQQHQLNKRNQKIEKEIDQEIEGQAKSSQTSQTPQINQTKPFQIKQSDYMPQYSDFYIKNGRKSLNPSRQRINRKTMNKKMFPFIDYYNRSEIIFPKIDNKSIYYRSQLPKMHKFDVLNEGKQNKLFLIGDSHIWLMQRRFKQLYLQSLSKQTRTQFPTIVSLITFGVPYLPCNGIWNFSLQLLKDHMPKRVLIVQRWTHYLQYTDINGPLTQSIKCFHGFPFRQTYKQSWQDIQSDIQAFKQRLIQITQLGIQVYVTTLQMQQRALQKSSMLQRGEIGRDKIRPISYNQWRNVHKKLLSQFQSAVKSANATLIDFADDSCWNDICEPLIPTGYPIMRDRDHFANYYARYWVTTVDFLVQF